MDEIEKRLYAEEQIALLKSSLIALKEAKVNFIERGDWVEGTQYKVLDLVKHGQKNYIALNETRDNPTSSDKWADVIDYLKPKEGPQGIQGVRGFDGVPGIDGTDGRDGKDGQVGKQGETGKTGVTGPKGPKGDKGDKGDPGNDGLSAYEVWLKEGNKGSEQQFLNSLKGVPGYSPGAGSRVPNGGSIGQVLKKNSAADQDLVWGTVSGGGGSAHTIQEEGSSLTARSNLNFIGALVTATDDSANDATKVTIATPTKSDVGLGSVDNTADTAKPVSTAQQTAIDAKVIDSIADSDTTHAPSRNAVFDALALKAPLASPTFTGTVTVPTPTNATDASTKGYVDSAVVGLLDYRGSYDASTNLFPATGGSGLVGAVVKGDFWICSVAGTLGGTSVTAGDLIIALIDTPAQTAANWDLISNEIGYAPENVANKDTDGTLAANSDTKYASQKAAKTYSDTKIPKSLVDVKGDIITATANDTPSRKAVGSNGKVLVPDSSSTDGLSYEPSNPSSRIGTITYIGHSWIAGVALSATGTPNFEKQGISGRLNAMLGIHENNSNSLAISGSYASLYRNFSFTGTPSVLSGWAGILGLVIPNSSPLYSDTATSVLANPAIANPTAYYFGHHINDMAVYGANTTTINYISVERAWKHAVRSIISRCRAGALYSSYKDSSGTTQWQSEITFSGGTTTAQTLANTGPAIRRSTTNGDTMTFTIPLEVPATFTVAMCFIGNGNNWFKSSTAMNNTDATTAIVITPANTDVAVGDVMQNATTGSTELLRVSTVTDSTHITFTRGFNGTTKASHSINDEFVRAQNGQVNFTTSGSNANITGSQVLSGQGIGGGLGSSSVAVVKRFACTSADAGKTIVATVAGLIATDNSTVDFDSVWIEANNPPPFVVEKMPRFAWASPYLYISTAQQAALNTDTAAVVAEFDSMVAISDIDTPWYSHSANLTNSALNNTTAGTITGITLDANGTDFAANIGTVITHNGEDMLITAVSGSYPSYTISVTRGYHSTTKVVHTSGTMVSDQYLMHTDGIHPNGFGHGVRAKVAYDTFNSILANTTAQQYNIAMSGGNETQDNRTPVLGLVDNNYLYPQNVNTWATNAVTLNKLIAIPVYIPQLCILTEIGAATSAAAAGVLRFGVYDLDQARSRPGSLIQDFGTVSNNVISNDVAVTSIYKVLRPGWYYFAVVQQTAAATMRTFANAGAPGNAPIIMSSAVRAAAGTVYAYSQASITGALPSTWGTTFTEETTNVPIIHLRLRVKHYF
jgi:hypothetical protein